MSATKITADAVDALMQRTLVKERDDPNALRVNGLTRVFLFDPQRIAEIKDEIGGLLDQLPDQFHRSKGGGWSFLNACMDRDGRQWGEHRDIEALICLGIAVGSASFLLLDMRGVLPGGMPYLEVHPGEIGNAA